MSSFTDEMLTKITTITSYSTSLGGFILSMSLGQWIAIGSLILAVCTYLTNSHYQKKRNARELRKEKREEELHDLKKAKLQAELNE